MTVLTVTGIKLSLMSWYVTFQTSHMKLIVTQEIIEILGYKSGIIGRSEKVTGMVFRYP